MKKTILLTCILGLAPGTTWAQTTEDCQEKIKVGEERPQVLGEQMRTIKADQPLVAPALRRRSFEGPLL